MSWDTKASLLVLLLLNLIGWIITLRITNKQHRNNIKLARENFRIELGAKISEKALTLVWRNIRDISSLIARLSSLCMFKNDYTTAINPTINAQNWIKFINECQELWKATQDSFFDMLLYIESREVVLNKFVKIRMSLQEENRLVCEVANKFINKTTILKYGFTVQPETTVDYDELKVLEEQFSEKLFDLEGFMYDVQIALQNAYLSDIYDYSVSDRKPKDESIKILKPE